MKINSLVPDVLHVDEAPLPVTPGEEGYDLIARDTKLQESVLGTQEVEALDVVLRGLLSVLLDRQKVDNEWFDCKIPSSKHRRTSYPDRDQRWTNCSRTPWGTVEQARCCAQLRGNHREWLLAR